MSEVTIKMREYEPQKGQKTQRLTWRGQTWEAGNEKSVTKAVAEILLAIKAYDGQPLFVKQEEPATEIVVEDDEVPRVPTKKDTSESKPKRKYGGRGTRR